MRTYKRLQGKQTNSEQSQPDRALGAEMHLPIYYLRSDTESGHELSGGRLTKELRYPRDRHGVESAKRLVGFLSQITGAELRICDERGELIETRIFREGVAPSKNELGNVRASVRPTPLGK